MRQIVQQKSFKTDLKKIARSGRYRVKELLAVIDLLMRDRILPLRNHDHALIGAWADFRECHIRPDWLLIYRLEPGQLVLVRTGSHSELFD